MQYFINGKEVTAQRYAAMERLNAYINRGGINSSHAGRVYWFTLEVPEGDTYGDITRYINNCKRFGLI